jgi:hypothetical protein
MNELFLLLAWARRAVSSKESLFPMLALLISSLYITQEQFDYSRKSKNPCPTRRRLANTLAKAELSAETPMEECL